MQPHASSSSSSLETEFFDLRSGARAAASSYDAMVALTKNSEVPLRVGETLAKGSFGSVSEATYRGESGWVVKTDVFGRHGDQMATQEIAVLTEMKGVRGFPKLRAVVRKDTQVQMVIQQLPVTLAQLTHIAPLPSEDISRIAVQALDALEALHDKGWVHRDIKPENMMLDDRSFLVYLIDFGLAKKIIRDGVHVPDTTRLGLLGTPRYCSVQVHQGHTHSRRDDLESLLYSLKFMEDGHLPWVGAGLRRDRNYEAHLRKKLQVGDCIFYRAQGILYQHVRSLAFDQRPDYNMLREAFLKEIPGSSRTKITQFKYLSRELEQGRPTRQRIDELKAVAQVAIRGLRAVPKIRARVLRHLLAEDRANWALLAHGDPSASVSAGASTRGHGYDEEKSKKHQNQVNKQPVEVEAEKEKEEVGACCTVGVQNIVCDSSVLFRIKIPLPWIEIGKQGSVDDGCAFAFTNCTRVIWCYSRKSELTSLSAVSALDGNCRHYRFSSRGPLAMVPWRSILVSASGCLVRVSDTRLHLVSYQTTPMDIEVGSTPSLSGTCQVHHVTSSTPIAVPWLIAADSPNVVICHGKAANPAPHTQPRQWRGGWQIFKIEAPSLKLVHEFFVTYHATPCGAAYSQSRNTIVVWFADQVIFHRLRCTEHDEDAIEVMFEGCRDVVLWGNYWLLYNATELAFVHASSLDLHPRRIRFSEPILNVIINNESVLVAQEHSTRIVEGEDLLKFSSSRVELCSKFGWFALGVPRCLLFTNATAQRRIVVASFLIEVPVSSPLIAEDSESNTAKRHVSVDDNEVVDTTTKHPRL